MEGREQMKRKSASPHLATKLAATALSLLLAGLLLCLSVPRLIAELALLPGNPVLDTIKQGDPPSDKDLETLVASRERALAWTESGRIRADLAFAQQLLAQQEVGGGVRYRQLVAQATQSLRAGLAEAPADAYGWTMLAHAAIAADEPSSRIVPLLQMAIRTAPVEPDLVFARLELCFILWPAVTATDPTLCDGQVPLAVHQSSVRLARLAHATSREDTVRGLLVGEDGAEFERELRAED
jgi:hypothetical protein